MRWKEHIARLWRHAKWPVTWTLWAVLMAWLAVALWHGCNGSASPGDRHPLPTAVRDSLLSVDCCALPHVVHRRYTAFEVDYDTALHLPRCVAYELRRDMLGGDAQRYDDFVADPSVPGCAQPEAYHGSGMHRGHMAPAADMANNEQAMRESFFMTNICPQDASLNEGGWARLEEKVREWTLRDSALLVFAGPVIDSIDSTTRPAAFFKVVVNACAARPTAVAFIYPNAPSNGPLKQYAVTIDEVQRRTALRWRLPWTPQECERIKTCNELEYWQLKNN